MQYREIGSFEAKTHFSQLLATVEAGNEIVITKHGKRVATIAPYQEINKVDSVKEAMESIRNLRKGIRLNPPGAKKKVTIRELIEEGRRY